MFCFATLGVGGSWDGGVKDPASLFLLLSVEGVASFIFEGGNCANYCNVSRLQSVGCLLLPSTILREIVIHGVPRIHEEPPALVRDSANFKVGERRLLLVFYGAGKSPIHTDRKVKLNQ